MKFLKIIALPLSFLYGLVLYMRNKAYDFGVLSSKEFKMPVISIGNLSTGGTGKTPHIEYLIRLLKPKNAMATLSRGYGRSTNGFIVATEHSTTFEIGDEPRQFKRKFFDVNVVVENNRVKGIKKIQELFPEVNITLLDDAFQHRAVKSGLSILLTEYNKLFYNDYVLPSGNLREFKSGYKRADIIIVTKTPLFLSPLEKKIIIKEINPEAYQKIYFSYIKYGNFIPLMEEKRLNDSLLNNDYYFSRNYSILLLTGIADSSPLQEYLKENVKNFSSVHFKDHHEYSITELLELKKTFNELTSENKIIVTTEKDAMRLDKPGLMEVLKSLPVFYIPIEVAFHGKDEEEFNKNILDFISGFMVLENKSGASRDF